MVDRQLKINKKAQITVFMIIGLLILFAFIFVLQIANSAKLATIQQEAEDLISGSFRKEALRIFVDDCLEDELEQGLVLLSKQGGRFWDDQAAGSRPFSTTINNAQEFNGVQVDQNEGGRVFYAIKEPDYQTATNAYPCSSEQNSPVFCQYSFPDNQVNYGSQQLRLSSIEADLQRFLAQQVRTCVTEFTYNNISRFAQIEETNIELNVDIFNDGIAVNVNYPLRFKLEGREFFHLSNFDFFYPTVFKQLLDTAVLIPLSRDLRYGDFPYDEQTLLSDSFTFSQPTDLGNNRCTLDAATNTYQCTQAVGTGRFSSLSLQLTKSDVQQRNQLNGDTIFTFTPPAGTIAGEPNYFLRIARENRPPALSYIARSSCVDPTNLIPATQQYDYLVIKDSTQQSSDGTLLGNLDITPIAIDPDEDNALYSFDYSTLGNLQNSGSNNQLLLSSQSLTATPEGLYTIRVQAQDPYGAIDYQDVRVLIDRPLNPTINLRSPYDDISYGQVNGPFIISREDPVFVDLAIPSNSITGVSGTATLQLGTEAPQQVQPNANTNQACFSLPGGLQGVTDGCDLTYYPDDPNNPGTVVANINTPGNYPRTPFANLPSGATTITLDFSTNYCGNLPQQTSISADVFVTECVPHRNADYPFPAPYHNIDPVTGQQRTDPISNPFLANHACCVFDPANPADASRWDLAPAGTECFVNPNPGCYGQKVGVTDLSSGRYVLEQQIATCDGIRGNTCGSLQSDFIAGPLHCGTNNQNSCSGIAAECQDSDAWRVKTFNDVTGLCHGTLGCSNFCSTHTVVDRQQQLNVPNYVNTNLNQRGKDNNFIADNSFGVGLHCGCTAQDVTQANRCDGNFDGLFNGVCEGVGVCNEP